MYLDGFLARLQGGNSAISFADARFVAKGNNRRNFGKEGEKGFLEATQ
jgi:hypothetical protein